MDLFNVEKMQAKLNETRFEDLGSFEVRVTELSKAGKPLCYSLLVVAGQVRLTCFCDSDCSLEKFFNLVSEKIKYEESKF